MSGSAFPVAKLWEKVSAKGNRYLVGRMGGARILVMENTRPEDGDTSTHTLMFAEAPSRATTGRQAASSEPSHPTSPRPAVQRDRPRRESPRQQIEDDVVPF
jgi:hypothetical protein